MEQNHMFKHREQGERADRSDKLYSESSTSWRLRRRTGSPCDALAQGRGCDLSSYTEQAGNDCLTWSC